jgi:putative ABC transport system permease protein
MKTNYKKIIRDLTKDKSKNLLLILAVAVGVFGIGTIVGAYAVVSREMKANYLGTHPASATIETEGTFITTETVEEVKNLPGIKEAERHATVTAAMKINGRWHPMLLFVKDNFGYCRTNTVYHSSGENSPPELTMLVERTALQVMKTTERGKVIVKIPNGKETELTVSGIVHDPGLAPAWQEETGYGYITLSTLHQLGATQDFNELRIIVDDSLATMEKITEKSKYIAAMLSGKGYKIHEVQIPPPFRHPHQTQMSTILSLFTIFTFMLLALSSVLVATSVSTLMVRQVREIGIMKTLGAKSTQISFMYFFMILVIGLSASIIAIPLSRFGAKMMYSQISTLLNLRIFDDTIPVWVMVVQISTGLIIPLLAALVPVLRGSRKSIREALDNYGLPKQNNSNGIFSILSSSLKFKNTGINLSLRNIFRQKARLIMTLTLLSAGGAMFMTALNVSDAWDNNLTKIYKYRKYDLETRLHDFTNTDKIRLDISKMKGVNKVEAWSYSSTCFVKDVNYNIVNTYPDKGHGSFSIVGVSLPTELLNPNILKGRWLKPSDEKAVVLNQMVQAINPDIRIGDSKSLSIDNLPSRWKVVGIVEDVGSPATAYVPLNTFSKFAGTEDLNNLLFISYADRSKEYNDLMTGEVEKYFFDNNIAVDRDLPVSLLHNAMAEHMSVLINSLIAMAILLAIVGGLGLMSTMSISIMERTREIGIMRAIGATPLKIRKLVTTEGMIIASLSLVIAFGFSLFLSKYLGIFLGEMAFRTPLDLIISAIAIVLWIILIIAGSILATTFPARRAGRISVREAIAYE